MDRLEAIVWVWSVCSALRQSQTKTLADLVDAALSVGRVSLAEIGRPLDGHIGQARHQALLALHRQSAGRNQRRHGGSHPPPAEA